MKRWTLYYEDGMTFSDTDGRPWHSPEWGVVAVYQPDSAPIFRSSLINGDFFLYRTDLDCWWEVDRDGLIDQLVHYAHVIGCVRQGRYTRKDVFQRVRERIDG